MKGKTQSGVGGRGRKTRGRRTAASGPPKFRSCGQPPQDGGRPRIQEEGMEGQWSPRRECRWVPAHGGWRRSCRVHDPVDHTADTHSHAHMLTHTQTHTGTHRHTSVHTHTHSHKAHTTTGTPGGSQRKEQMTSLLSGKPSLGTPPDEA